MMEPTINAAIIVVVTIAINTGSKSKWDYVSGHQAKATQRCPVMGMVAFGYFMVNYT